MTRRVPRGLEDARAAVAEYVMVTGDHLRPDVRVSTERGRVDTERWRCAHRPGELGVIDDPDRRAEEICVASVIEVEVRERDMGHVRRGEAQGLQLLGERHRHPQANAACKLDAV